jgi:hypothetical protein
MSGLTVPAVELAIDDRIRDRLDALMEVMSLDFRAMAVAVGLDPATSFRGKRIHFLDFGESDLTGFDFSGADLTGCDFSRAKIGGVNFAGACLDKARGVKEKRVPMVFISYARADLDAAQTVANRLKRRGISFFIDESFRVGQVFGAKISDELKKASHFLFIASPRSLQSKSVIAELNAAIRIRMMYDGELAFIAVLHGLTASQTSFDLQHWLIVDFDGLDAALDHIAADILRWPPPRPASVSTVGEEPSKYLDHLPVDVDPKLGFSAEEGYWCEQSTEGMLRSSPTRTFGISFHEDLLTAELRKKPDGSEYLLIRAATSDEVRSVMANDDWVEEGERGDDYNE